MIYTMKLNMGINRALEIIDLNYSVNQGIFSSWPYSLIQINRYKCLTFSPHWKPQTAHNSKREAH